MGIITKAFTFVDGVGNKIFASQVNKNFDDLYALINGGIDSANAPALAALVTQQVPPGTIIMSAASVTPTGYLACDGTAVSRTGANAALFAAVGTVYGPGNGTTTFNLPDLRGRAPVGAGTGSGLTARALGSSGGAEGKTVPGVDHLHSGGSLFVTGHSRGTPNHPSLSGSGEGVAYSNSNSGIGGGATGSADRSLNSSVDVMQPYQAVNYFVKI